MDQRWCHRRARQRWVDLWEKLIPEVHRSFLVLETFARSEPTQKPLRLTRLVLDVEVGGILYTAVQDHGWVFAATLNQQAMNKGRAEEGTIYLYLFDWAATVVVLYLVVRVLSPLEPRNLFPGIGEALEYFVKDRGIFVFTGYFWRSKPDEHTPTIRSSDSDDPPLSWGEFAVALHKETVDLDKFLSSTWQGENSRVSLVFEEELGPEGQPARAYCVHYRRLGESAFVVAVDAQGNRFDGSNTKSQSDFLQFSGSIGCLVNVRHSLKYSSTRSGGDVFW